MNQSPEQLWETLQDAGVVQGDMPEVSHLDSPWYVRTMLAFSGWFASLFVLGFIGVAFTFVVENSMVALFVGALMIVAAYFLLRLPKNEFFEHLALAISLAGQVLVMWAIVDNAHGGVENVAWFMIAAIQTTLAIVMPNFVHRVFSTFIAGYSFSGGLEVLNVPYMFSGIIMFSAAWLWLHEYRFPQRMKILHPIAYGLVLSLIQLKGSALFGASTLWGIYVQQDVKYWVQPWMGELITSAALLYVVSILLVRRGYSIKERFSVITLLSTGVLCLASMEANGITAAIMVLLLGFAGGNRILLGLGIVSLLFFISTYYYLLEVSLLAKSQTLFIVGVVLLVARWLMLRFMPVGTEAKHG